MMEQEKYKSLPFSYKLARFCVLLHRAYPFLGELCMRVEKYYKEDYALAATDGVRLYLNVDELGKLPEESVNFVLLHELFHIILRHKFPKETPFYEKIYWNIGFDLVINWLLMSMSSELKSRDLAIIPVAGTFLAADDLSQDPSEVIAKTFVRQAIEQGILSENPPVFVDIEWKSFKYKIIDISSFIFDILDGDAPGIFAEDSSGEAEIRNLLASCAKSAGIYGLPWQLRGLWDEMCSYRKLPWFLILKRYLEGMKNSEDFDFCPPDKRTLYRDLIAPAEITEEGEELNNALIILDVSSSVDKEELLAQIWQIRCILTALDFKGSIISFGSSVYQEAVLSNKQSLKCFIDELKIGGGTQWSSVVDYVKENKRGAKPIIVFTDGYLFSYDKGLSDVIFITQSSYPHELNKLGKVIDIRLLLWSLTDLKGIPYPDDTHTYTKWLINDILPRPERDGDNGILLLEELDDAPKTVRAAAYQLTLDRRLGSYCLCDGWYIIATSNREQDGGAYTSPLAPLNDRFEIHEVEPDFATWRDYAIKTGCNPQIVAYLSANQTALYTYKPDESADLVFATPRSWSAVSDLLDSGLKGEVLRIKTEANVGLAETNSFLKYIKNIKLLPDIEALLNGAYTGDNKLIYKAPLDAYWLLVQNLIYAIGTQFRKTGKKWQTYADNSVDFICDVKNFPLELKKSYVDQLCEIDTKIKKYMFTGSRNQKLTGLLQELEYIKR